MKSESPRPDLEPVAGPARTVAVGANRAVYWISRHWLFLFNLAVATFIALPFLAPALMNQGLVGPANLIYKVYSPTCHQMAFRSWFLFGEQSAYPLSETGLSDVTYFEEYVKDDPHFEGVDPAQGFGVFAWAARGFQGNEQMGFKVSLCQRDVAIYLALLAGGLLYGLLRPRVRPLPWQLFLLFGVIPMMVDGGYQLLTYMLPNFLPPHETTPLLRTITGALFGFGLAWLALPQIQIGMTATETELREKLLRAKIIS